MSVLADIKAEIARAHHQLEILESADALAPDELAVLRQDLVELEDGVAGLSSDLPDRVLEIMQDRREEWEADLVPSLDVLRKMNNEIAEKFGLEGPE